MRAVLTLLGGGARAEEEVETGARAAVLIERNTGMVLLCHNENEPLPMASTTKVMTALLALEKGNLDDVVTVGRNAYGVPGTSIYLNLGEHITLRNLLYGLLLASGNDAAVAIAEHIGGSVEAFCANDDRAGRPSWDVKTRYLSIPTACLPRGITPPPMTWRSSPVKR